METCVIQDDNRLISSGTKVVIYDFTHFLVSNWKPCYHHPERKKLHPYSLNQLASHQWLPLKFAQTYTVNQNLIKNVISHMN